MWDNKTNLKLQSTLYESKQKKKFTKSNKEHSVRSCNLARKTATCQRLKCENAIRFELTVA